MKPFARAVRFVQSDADRRRIYAIVTSRDSGSDPVLGYGPLTMDEIGESVFTEPYPTPAHPRLDPELGAGLVAREPEFHPLGAYFHFYGYPQEVIEWIEATPRNDPAATGYAAIGRDHREVAARLGLDPVRLHRAGMVEGSDPTGFDPAGDPLYATSFGENWAVADAAGRVDIDPDALRFKAWLSLEYDAHG